MGRDSFFDAYRDHPRWRQVAEALLGEPVGAEEPEWFNKPPGTVHVTPPHQDNYYFCLTPPHVLTIWLALDDVDAENGCLRYVAGSHTRGFRPHNRSNVLGFSQGISGLRAGRFGWRGGRIAARGRRGGAPRHDDSPGRRQPFAVAASPFLRHGFQGHFLPSRRRGVCQVRRLGPTAAPGAGSDHLKRRRRPACRKRTMMASEKHRVLIVGAGSIGERHLRCFQATGRASVSFVEISPALRQTIARAIRRARLRFAGGSAGEYRRTQRANGWR